MPTLGQGHWVTLMSGPRGTKSRGITSQCVTITAASIQEVVARPHYEGGRQLATHQDVADIDGGNDRKELGFNIYISQHSSAW